MPTVADIVAFLDAFAPPGLAADWDNVGLLLGEGEAAVNRLMTCLTVTPESADEAIEGGAELVVTHHPILFRGVKRLTSATSEGRMLLRLVRAGVGVYSPHTAFDNTTGGINDLLAGRLNLTDVKPLRRRPEGERFKLVVFVPDGDLARVSNAIFAAGAGHIGKYQECSFRLSGTGTFFGSELAKPTVGQKGRREEVQEWRVEVVCPAANVEGVVAAMRKAHSYEESAFDIYPLHASSGNRGDGRIGMLPEPTALRNFADHVRKSLGTGPVQVVGELDKSVRSVAIVCGAGGELLGDVLRAQADVFLTGELRFHDYLAAKAERLSLILPGHYATERCGVENLAQRIQEKWPAVTTWASKREIDPVQWI